jgi:hypothetical protein
MRSSNDQMTGIEKAMRIRKVIAAADSCRTACDREERKAWCPRLPADANRKLVGLLTLCLLLAADLGLSGCGSSSPKPSVGSITVTNVDGVAQPAVTTLNAGGGTYLDVSLTNDTATLGADWTVVCGSALPPGVPLPPGQTVDTSCGYFTPVHTASAPVPAYALNANGIVTFYTAPATPPASGTVTLYASSSADHSQFSALTLVIAGQPISVGIVASTAPPFTLAAGAAMTLTGTLSNDYTVGGGSITWSLTCQSSDCGSLSATTTKSGRGISYTAPANVPMGNTVTVTATSVTNPAVADSIVITII